MYVCILICVYINMYVSSYVCITIDQCNMQYPVSKYHMLTHDHLPQM